MLVSTESSPQNFQTHAFAECGRVSEEAPHSTFSWVAETQVARVETPSQHAHSLDFYHYTLVWARLGDPLEVKSVGRSKQQSLCRIHYFKELVTRAVK